MLVVGGRKGEGSIWRSLNWILGGVCWVFIAEPDVRLLKIKSPRKPSDDVSTESGRTDEVAGRTDEMTDEMTPGSGYNSMAPSTRATSSATSTRSYKEDLLGSETTKK
jgi:hypothetical protein